jgi:hypothetical protein
MYRDPSSLIGGFGKDAGAGGLSAAMVTIATWLKPDLPLEVALAIMVLLTALTGFARRAIEEWLARRGGGGTGTAGLVSIVALSAIVGLGCASTKSIPTSSDANVSAEGVTAKGGTIACAAGAVIELDGATGNVTKLACPTNLAWTDPPTAEETGALAQFGDALLGALRLPFDVLAAFGRAMATTAP